MEGFASSWWAGLKGLASILWAAAMAAGLWWLWNSGVALIGSGTSYAMTAYAAMEVLGFVAQLILRLVEWDIRKNQYGGEFPAPSSYPPLLWKREIISRAPGGWWLGFFERALYLGAALLGRWELVAGYLVLKSASKWKAWTATADSLKGQQPEDIRANLARAVLDHRRFLIGTIGNLVAALGGVGVAELAGLLGEADEGPWV
jgi:hypothetical protein